MWILLMCVIEVTSFATFENCHKVETYKSAVSCQKMLTEFRNVGSVIRRRTRTLDEAFNTERTSDWQRYIDRERSAYGPYYDEYFEYAAFECASDLK